jgi:hypothetical protein
MSIRADISVVEGTADNGTEDFFGRIIRKA